MTEEKENKRQKGWLKGLGKYKFVILVAALGALLLLWPTDGKEMDSESAAGQPPSKQQEETLAETERAMEEILGKISGVGQVDVMLTLQSGRQLVLAEDSSLRYSGSTHAPDDYDRSSDTVVVSSGGEQDVIVTQQRYPQYRGALVVCEGGGNDAVRLAVIGAVAALTGLGSDRIAVVKWQGNDAAEYDQNS